MDQEIEMQAEAGMSYTDITASAYRAYSASTGNKNFRGEPMPDFSALPEAIQTAWEAAVRHTLAIAMSTKIPDPLHLAVSEKTWEGWKRP